MKQIMIIMTLVFALVSNVFAVDPTQVSEDMRDKIVELMETPDFGYTNIVDELATIEFVLNAKNEIVVIDVNTASQYLEDYIKIKLNYKKLDLEVDNDGKFEIAIRFKNADSIKS